MAGDDQSSPANTVGVLQATVRLGNGMGRKRRAKASSLKDFSESETSWGRRATRESGVCFLQSSAMIRATQKPRGR